MKNLGLVVAVLFLASCVKDKPVASSGSALPLSTSKKVYVINEGNFGTGNASVSLYDPGTGNVIENVYQSVNAAAVGDVAQSMGFSNGHFYLVVNNSGKIVVCDEKFKKSGQINGLTSPRYFQPISNQKAYVSDFKSNAISVIDLNQNLKVGEIACAGWTEQMQMIYNKVFVCNVKRNYVYVLNTLSDTKTDSVFVGANAYCLQLDRNDRLWVLSSGDATKNIKARLSRINVLNLQVELYHEFGLGDTPGNLCLNKGKDTLFFLNKHIYSMGIDASALPAQELVNAGTKNFYGLGIHPTTFQIYAADALDYTQKSNIYIYNSKGNQLSFFKAGINSNGFYFE